MTEIPGANKFSLEIRPKTTTFLDLSLWISKDLQEKPSLPFLSSPCLKNTQCPLPCSYEDLLNFLNQSHKPTRSALGRARISPKYSPIFVHRKMPEFLENSPLSGAGKTP